MEKFLKNCGLKKSIKIFSDNGVHLDQIDRLTENEIKELLPKVGDRVTFRDAVEARKVAQEKKKNDEVNLSRPGSPRNKKMKKNVDERRNKKGKKNQVDERRISILKTNVTHRRKLFDVVDSMLRKYSENWLEDKRNLTPEWEMIDLEGGLLNCPFCEATLTPIIRNVAKFYWNYTNIQRHFDLKHPRAEGASNAEDVGVNAMLEITMNENFTNSVSPTTIEAARDPTTTEAARDPTTTEAARDQTTTEAERYPTTAVSIKNLGISLHRIDLTELPSIGNRDDTIQESETLERSADGIQSMPKSNKRKCSNTVVEGNPKRASVTVIVNNADVQQTESILKTDNQVHTTDPSENLQFLSPSKQVLAITESRIQIRNDDDDTVEPEPIEGDVLTKKNESFGRSNGSDVIGETKTIQNIGNGGQRTSFPFELKAPSQEYPESSNVTEIVAPKLTGKSLVTETTVHFRGDYKNTVGQVSIENDDQVKQMEHSNPADETESLIHVDGEPELSEFDDLYQEMELFDWSNGSGEMVETESTRKIDNSDHIFNDVRLELKLPSPQEEIQTATDSTENLQSVSTDLADDSVTESTFHSQDDNDDTVEPESVRDDVLTQKNVSFGRSNLSDAMGETDVIQKIDDGGLLRNSFPLELKVPLLECPYATQTSIFVTENLQNTDSNLAGEPVLTESIIHSREDHDTAGPESVENPNPAAETEPLIPLPASHDLAAPSGELQVPLWKKEGVKFGWVKSRSTTKYIPGFITQNDMCNWITAKGNLSIATFLVHEFRENIADDLKKNKIKDLLKFNKINGTTFV